MKTTRISRDPVPMIDLTRRLPTLQDSLTPPPRAPSLAHDVITFVVLAALGSAITYLVFGL